MKEERRKVRSWEDLIFVGHNKNYGAYVIRRAYPRNIFISMVIAVILVALVLSIPEIKKIFADATAQETTEMKVLKYTELAPPPSIQKNTPPPQKTIINPVRKVIKYVPPKVTKQQVVEKQDMPTADQTRHTDTGLENVEGDSNAEPVVAEQKIVDDRPVDKVFDTFEVDRPPQFKNGLKDFYEFVGKNLRYPARAESKEIQGTVYMTFVIDTDGTVTSVEVEKGLFPDCDKEAGRVLRKAPKWTPGSQKGKPVKVRMRMPIKFTLSTL